MIARFQAVTKHYTTGDGVTDLNFEIEQGEIIGLLGLNGSGKTTSLKLLSSLLHSNLGQVLIQDKKPKEARHDVAFLGDRQGFPDWMNPTEMARFMRTFYKDFCDDTFLHLRTELNIPNKTLGAMSKGQKQKLKLAATMGRKARLYLLDEPLSGIDLVARHGILESLIGSWGKDSSIILATHEIKDVESYLTRAMFLRDGRLVENESTESLQQKGTSVSERFMQLMGDTGS